MRKTILFLICIYYRANKTNKNTIIIINIQPIKQTAKKQNAWGHKKGNEENDFILIKYFGRILLEKKLA